VLCKTLGKVSIFFIFFKFLCQALPDKHSAKIYFLFYKKKLYRVFLSQTLGKELLYFILFILCRAFSTEALGKDVFQLYSIFTLPSASFLGSRQSTRQLIFFLPI